LPGLIIDIYNNTAIIQMHSIGMYHIRDQLSQAIKDIYGDRLISIYDKSEATLPYKANLGAKMNLFWVGATRRGNRIGNKFLINWIEGQKTGFFIDQRENRKLVSFIPMNGQF